MRLRLKLTAQDQKSLSINYQFQLSTALSNLLHFNSPEFLDYLKYLQIKIEGKKFKFFTFSLRLENLEADKDRLVLLSPEANVYVASPLIDEFIEGFVSTLANKELVLNFEKERFVFTINQADLLPVPEFCEEMKFNLLTPMVLTTKRKDAPERKSSYLIYSDPLGEYNRVLKGNLVKKYFLIMGKTIENKDFRFEWDRNFIKQRLEDKKKLTTRTTLDILGNQLHIIGSKIPFTVKGNTELLKIGYECGFGEKNSMGFGMVKLLDKPALDKSTISFQF